MKRNPVRVLVCFGGSDPSNMTSLTLDAIASIKDLQLEVDIVIGSGHQAKKDVIAKVSQINLTAIGRTRSLGIKSKSQNNIPRSSI